MAANHANTKGAKALPPVFGALVDAIAWASLDLGVAFPSMGCLVPGFEASLMIETLGFVAVSGLFVIAWAVFKAKGDEDAWIHLWRLVVFCKLFLPAITRSLFQALSW